MDSVTVTKEVTEELRLPKFILAEGSLYDDGDRLCNLLETMLGNTHEICQGISCRECLLDHIKVTKE